MGGIYTNKFITSPLDAEKDGLPGPIILAIVLSSSFAVMVLLTLGYFLLIRKEEETYGEELGT